MKKIIYIFCVSLLTGSLSFAQNINVPKNAIDIVNARFHGADPETSNATWSKIGSKYQLNYTYSDKKRTLIFNDKGDFLQSWIEIPNERLKSEVTKYLKVNYPKATILQAYELTSNTAPERNIVDIVSDGEKIRLRFRPNGTFYISEKTN